MDPTVVAACDLAVNFVFGPTATYRPIGSAADTAFSGSAVIELEVLVVIPKTTTTTTTATAKTTNGKNNAHTNITRVVLKHSSVRTLSKSFVTTSTSDEEEDDVKCKSSQKYAAALKVDQSSRNEYAFLQSYSEKLLQLPPNNIDDDDGISSISNKYKNKNDDAGEIKLVKTKTRIPRTLFARNHPTEGITLLLESLSSFGDSCGNDIDNDNDNDKDDNTSNHHHSSDTNADNNAETATTTTTTSTSTSSTSSGGRVIAIPLGPKMNATLEWIANFHASFLPRSLNPNTFLNNDDDNSDSDLAAAKEVKEKEQVEEKKKLSSLLWSIGTHHSLEKRSPIELQQLPIDLKEFVERFQKKNEKDNENDNNDHDCCCDYFQTPPAKQQGQRIQDVAVDVAHYLHPDNNPAHKTIVHGDYKQGNMFFAATTTNNNNTAAVTSTATTFSSSRNNNDKDIDIDANTTHQQEKIAVFDWQWTGPGLGATDLVYLCVMAVSDEALVDYEMTIVRPYHNYLLQALTTTTRRKNSNKNNNVDGTTTTNNNNNNNDDDDELYPYNDLLKEFKIAMIDIQRWLGGSRYKSMTLESVLKAKQNIDINHGIFRRSMTRIVWIFKIVDLALDDIESGRIQLGQTSILLMN